MALKELNIENIREDLENNDITNAYADRLNDVIDELINNRGYGGPMIDDDKGEPCGECVIRVHYNSPRPGNYKDWVWIEVLGQHMCNLWVHLDYNDGGDWSWSVWRNGPFPNSVLIENFRMPPDFIVGPVYKTGNRRADLVTVFDEICAEMPNLCDCYGIR